jgi:DNA-directed RNA polymerase specialized sigma24 family protein
MWPPDDQLCDAVRRLVADPTTAGAFAELVLPPLEADLRRHFPRTDPHAVTEAADWAVAAFLRTPTAFDPARGPLPAFLRLAARRDLINILRQDDRHHRGRIPWAGVELAHPAGNEGEVAETFAGHPELAAAVAGLDEADRAVFELMLDGERDTAVFAAVLGIADRPADEQFDEVKRAKDRVKARLKRAGRGS